jgi:hypothetical protein
MRTPPDQSLIPMPIRSDGYVTRGSNNRFVTYPWTRISKFTRRNPSTNILEKCTRYELYPIKEEHGFLKIDLGRRYVLDVNDGAVTPNPSKTPYGKSWHQHSVICD